MNPTKGKGIRYIYCPHDGGACLDMVAKQGWLTFNCEKCAIYMNSESAGKYSAKRIEHREDAGAQGTVPIDEHVASDKGTGTVPLQSGKEGEEMTEKCLVPECEKEGKHRGLCSAHIQRYRKGTLPGIEPLPSNRGKGSKKDRINLLKESAERVSKKAKGFRLKTEREEIKPEDRSQKTEGKKWQLLLASDPASTDIVSSPAFNVERMEDQNRADVKVFARAFMAGLKSEFIAAMTEQISGQAQGPAPTE